MEKQKKRRRSRDGELREKKQRVESSEDESMEEAPAVAKPAPKSRYQLVTEDPLFPESRAAGPIEHEELASGKELWLFQVPARFDVDSLDGKTLKVEKGDGEVARLGLQRGKKKATYSVHLSESSQHRKLVNVFPSSQQKAFLFGVPFAHQLNLSESIAVPSAQKLAVKLPREVKKEPLQGLEGRYRPFGGGSAVPKGTFAAKSRELGVCTRKELQSLLGGDSTKQSPGGGTPLKKGRKRVISGDGDSATPPKKKKKRKSIDGEAKKAKKKKSLSSGTPDKAKKKKKKSQAS